MILHLTSQSVKPLVGMEVIKRPFYPRNDIAIMRPEGVSTRQRDNSLLKIASIRGDYTISGGLYVFALTRDHEHPKPCRPALCAAHRLRGTRKKHEMHG